MPGLCWLCEGTAGTGCPLGLWFLHMRSLGTAMRILFAAEPCSPDLHSAPVLVNVGFGIVQPSKRNPNILS